MIMVRLRRYFISGLLFWIPLLVTIWVIRFFMNLTDRSLVLLPPHYQPDNLLGFHVPGLGFVVSFLVIIITGIFVANFIGNRILALWENILKRIPLVRSIYSSVKQVMETIFAPGGSAFRHVVLVEYPRRGLWSVAFQTASGFVTAKDTIGSDCITIFIPTTPNPTSGFLMVVAKSDTVPLKMSVDEAFKLVVSLGVILPKGQMVDNGVLLPENEAPSKEV